MRLLKLTGPGKLSLVEVATHDAPPYAILSHTWTEGEEVTFKDLIEGDGKSKPGYKKITFCAERAAIDNLHYFWVDTCCIDKSNNNELTEAINSMFRWYRNAARCYAYLADVSTPSYNSDPQRDQNLWEASFQKSRWFTRGWTLQELIAPMSVEFFTSDGKLLGDKKSLQKQIHEISGIPIQALQGTPISQFSIAERMAWAAKRQTTKEEDQAYCLLGICEVSMPLVYGEGKTKALNRLLREVDESSRENHDIKEHDANDAPFLVPFERNARFTGRETQLGNLEQRLFGGQQTTRVAIAGLGGIGKTQIALELAYRTRLKYRKCLVLWIPTTDAESLHHAYVNIAQQLNITGWDDEKVDIKRLLQAHLSKESTGQWLLVFDNADDINIWITPSGSGPGSRGLIDYLPRSKRGCIIFTTRDRKTAVKLTQQHVVEVPEMNSVGATQLLRTCLINPDLVNDQEATKSLLEQLAHLPLAIVQAAAYINENGIRLVDYLSLLAEQEENVIDLLSEEFEDEWRYSSVKNPVATTWLISFEQIRRRDLLAADYLSFMACIERLDIPQSLLPPGTSRKQEIDAIGTLDSYSFIVRRPADMALDLHRLVHLATRNWLRKEGLISQWTQRSITQLEQMVPYPDHENRSVWRTYLPHARYALGSGPVVENVKARLDLVWKVGWCLYHDGRYNESETYVTEVVETRKIALGPEHYDTLSSMSSLTTVLVCQGKYNEAEPICQKTLRLRQKILGEEHPDTLTSMNSLASVLVKQGNYNEAEPIYRQTLRLRQKILGEECPDTLVSMNDLAALLEAQGKYHEAEPICRQTLQLGQKVLGEEHPSTLTSMNNLATLLESQEKFIEAEPICQQTLSLRQKVLGLEHPDTLTSMNNLSVLLDHQGKPDEAVPICRQALRLRQKVLGLEHPMTLTSMNNLAVFLDHQGKYDEAVPICRQMLQLNQKALGVEHPFTLQSMRNLAGQLIHQGKYDEAEPICRQMLHLAQKVLGPEHPKTLKSEGILQKLLNKQGA